jgi:hypothetical protein
MLNLIPPILVAIVYVGFRVNFIRDKKPAMRLIGEGFVLALFTHIVMWIYRQYWLREGMSTFGKRCPNGYEEVPDPSNSKQMTCVPSGQKTYPVVVGFGQMPDGPK